MPNTINPKLLQQAEKKFQQELEAEQKLLESMTESERIGYLAVKASLNPLN